MSRRTCTDCGTTEGVACYRLCEDCLTERVTAGRTAQGLPTPSESEVAHARLGAILDSAKRRPA